MPWQCWPGRSVKQGVDEAGRQLGSQRFPRSSVHRLGLLWPANTSSRARLLQETDQAFFFLQSPFLPLPLPSSPPPPPPPRSSLSLFKSQSHHLSPLLSHPHRIAPRVSYTLATRHRRSENGKPYLQVVRFSPPFPRPAAATPRATRLAIARPTDSSASDARPCSILSETAPLTGANAVSREHDAEEAFVTGTFDSWSKSVRLEKKNGIFQKTVHLDDSADKIYYKVRVRSRCVVSCHAALVLELPVPPLVCRASQIGDPIGDQIGDDLCARALRVRPSTASLLACCLGGQERRRRRRRHRPTTAITKRGPDESLGDAT